jgi:hypothetical protein
MPRKCCSTEHSITVQHLIQLACQLSFSELDELISALTALRDAISGSVPETPEVTSQAVSDRNGKSGSAHIVWKMIKGCGPYPYLRFREGRIYRSYYLKGLRKN